MTKINENKRSTDVLNSNSCDCKDCPAQCRNCPVCEIILDQETPEEYTN